MNHTQGSGYKAQPPASSLLKEELSEECSVWSPKDSQRDRAPGAHSSNPLVNALNCLPSLSCGLIPTLRLPGLTSQRNYLSLNPCLGVCFRDAQPKTLGHREDYLLNATQQLNGEPELEVDFGLPAHPPQHFVVLVLLLPGKRKTF